MKRFLNEFWGRIANKKNYLEELKKGARSSTNFGGCKRRWNKITNSIRRRQKNAEDFKQYYDNGEGKKLTCRSKFNVRKIDIVAFGIVGILFVLFNAMYWVTSLGLFKFEPSYISEKSTKYSCINSTDTNNSTYNNCTSAD